MPFYVRWTEDDGALVPGLSEEWTEIGADGVVTRELGFDRDGNIVHQCPSHYFPNGTYGHWDLAPVETKGLVNSVDPAEFERRWEQATSETLGRPRPPGAVRRLTARIIDAFRRP